MIDLMSTLPVWRRVSAWLIPIVGLPLLTSALVVRREDIELSSALLLYLLLVVASAGLGGLAPSVASAVTAFLLANWFFADPIHTLRIEEPHNLLAVSVFLVVAVVVSRFMATAVRRSAEAARATAEARTLAPEAARAATLAQTDEVRSALLQAVSHDLRTPLAGIKASASSLRQPDVTWSPAQIEEFLATIEHETDRLTALVENLLDMSRIQVGAVPVTMRRVGLEETVPGALALLGPRSRRVDIDLPETLPEVLADPLLLERMVANLVDNALAHTACDQSVRIEARAAGPRVMLRIVDRGPGIDPAAHEHVFQPFQRLGDGHRIAGAGVGLGLAVARGFARAIGGDILIEETPGGGATLVVELQAATP
jgi:two-component system, OmpR family, sensor histidine kinase KdpD